MPEQTRRTGRRPTGLAHQPDAYRGRKAELEQFALAVLELERLEHRHEVALLVPRQTTQAREDRLDGWQPQVRAQRLGHTAFGLHLGAHGRPEALLYETELAQPARVITRGEDREHQGTRPSRRGDAL